MSMVKLYHDKENTELHFSNWMDAKKLHNNVLLTTDNVGMDIEDESWRWEALDKAHQTSSSGKMECWCVSDHLKYIPLDPPLEFQDNPTETFIEKFAVNFISKLISEAFMVFCNISWSIPLSEGCHLPDSLPIDKLVFWNGLRLHWTPKLIASDCTSAVTVNLSNSYNSLCTTGSSNIEEFDHLKGECTRDAFTTKDISDMYNVPFDSDIYAVPVDVVPGNSDPSRNLSVNQDNYYNSSSTLSNRYLLSVAPAKISSHKMKECISSGKCNGFNRRLSSVGPTPCAKTEPIHLTVEEVRQYLKTLYSNSNDSSENKNYHDALKYLKNPFKSLTIYNSNTNNRDESRLNNIKTKNNFVLTVKNKKAKEGLETSKTLEHSEKFKKWSTCRPSFPSNIKETLCNIFRIKKLPSPDHCLGRSEMTVHSDQIGLRLSGHQNQTPPGPNAKPPFFKRALPPLPTLDDNHGEIILTNSTPLHSPEEPSALPLAYKSKQPTLDFASSIEKVKDCGWYWGPISGEAAEKILLNEPDGSFIVRDSSDDYYIFSLTFKLNSIIRHVRIEHDQGNFSFGSSTRFKSHTIVDFIESAVEHSRSGRYLFFLHRRPVLGPMRVQLLHPVSRFKQVQSLQHMCRFVILKLVRRDLIRYLPLPRRILDYLSTQHYYSEDFKVDDNSYSSTQNNRLGQFWPLDKEAFS